MIGRKITDGRATYEIIREVRKEITVVKNIADWSKKEKRDLFLIKRLPDGTCFCINKDLTSIGTSKKYEVVGE